VLAAPPRHRLRIWALALVKAVQKSLRLMGGAAESGGPDEVEPLEHAAATRLATEDSTR
jgi:hypothetical protein